MSPESEEKKLFLNISGQVVVSSCASLYYCQNNTIMMILDLSRALLVRGGSLVPLGLLDLLEDQVLRGLLGLLERKEFL